jgi:hypothetical protein
MAPSALITQTLGSRTARALLWARAGDPALHTLSLFTTPTSPGFGGRQAFGDKSDVFYSTVQSVVDKACRLADWYDGSRKEPKELFQTAVAVFPIVVIDGPLFTASLDPKADKLALHQTSSVRIHWRGSGAWRLHATIDIVAVSGLTDFAASRFRDAATLSQHLMEPFKQLQKCWTKKSLAPLEITSGPRGVVGLPHLLGCSPPRFSVEVGG